jgi:hypothetical protein
MTRLPYEDVLPADRTPDQLDMQVLTAVARIRAHVAAYRQVIATWEPRHTPEGE